MKKAVCYVMGMVGMLLLPHAMALNIFTIQPSVSSITTASNSQTSVTYTVTNNARVVVKDVTLTPGYLTTGNSGGFTVQNNTCSNISMIPGGSCTFGLIISGANQPSSFTITPRVCGNGGQACSYTGSANQLTVTVYTAPQTSYAYFEVMTPGPGVVASFSQKPMTYSGTCVSRTHGQMRVEVPPLCVSSLLPISTQTHTSGTALGGLCLVDAAPLGSGGVASLGAEGIASSYDGNTIYVAETLNSHSDADDDADIAVVSAGAAPQLLKRIALPGSNFCSEAPFMRVAVTPNDATLYVSSTNADNASLYGVNLKTSAATEILDQVSGAFDDIAITPDGSRAFVSNKTGGAGNAGAILVIDTATNTVVQTLDNAFFDAGVFNAPSGLAVSPDGSSLYVGNSGNHNILVINITGGYRLASIIDIAGAHAPDFVALAISGDGNTAYVSDMTDQQIDQITALQEAPQVFTLDMPDDSSASYGLSLTPDSANLWINMINALGLSNMPETPGVPFENVLTGLPATPVLTQVLLPTENFSLPILGNFVN